MSIKFVKSGTVMNEDEQKSFVETIGKTMLGIEKRKSTLDIALDVGCDPYQVEWNINEMLYILRKRVGWKRYIKILFAK